MNSCAGLFNPNAILTSISSGGGSSGSSSSSSLPTATSFPSSTTTSACSAVETEFREKAYIEIKKELERNLQDSILQLEDLKTMLLGTFPPIILDMKVKDALNGAIQEQLRPAKRLKTGGAEEAQQDGPGALQRKPLNTPGPDVVVAARTGFSAGHTRDQYGTGRANPEPGIKNGLASSPPLAGQTPLLAASVASSSAAAEVKQVNAANFPSRPGGFGPAPMRRVAGSPGPALAPAAAASAVSTTTTNPISRPMAGLASLFKPPAHDTDVLVSDEKGTAPRPRPVDPRGSELKADERKSSQPKHIGAEAGPPASTAVHHLNQTQVQAAVPRTMNMKPMAQMPSEFQKLSQRDQQKIIHQTIQQLARGINSEESSLFAKPSPNAKPVPVSTSIFGARAASHAKASANAGTSSAHSLFAGRINEK